MGGKRLGLLRELVPGAPRIALLVNPIASGAALSLKEVQASASAIGQQIDVFHASTNREIDTAFAALVQRQDAAVLTIPDALLFDRRVQLVTLAVRYGVPAIYSSREYVTSGGLMTYGPDIVSQYRRAAGYVDRILKGEKPADLPVQAPTKYELVINLRAAKAIGLKVPPSLLARADEVIE